MIMAQEQAILKGQAQLAEMSEFVRRASQDGRPIDEVERGQWQSLLALGRTLLEGYVAGVEPGDMGETLGYEGQDLRRLACPHDRRYVSVFGELTITRYVYGTRETQKHEVVPADAILGLPEGSEEARAFVTDRLGRLLRGEVGYVIGGLKQMATKQRLKGSKSKQLSAVIGYFERNRRFMRYDEYLAAGFPIGSGVAEGACRHLVKDRMEGTGMHWRIPGAQAMLDLRAVYVNGDWEAFQQQRVKQERRRLYPYRSRVQRERREAA